MPLKKSRWFVSAVCISLLAAGGAARAEDKPSVEPRAERILKAAIDYLAGAKSYMARGELNNELQIAGGQRIEYASTIQAAVRRPDRYWTRVEGQLRQTSNWYDGKTFTHLEMGTNVYAAWPAPSTTDQLLDTMQEKLGFVPPLAVLMRDDVGKNAKKNIKSGFYVGPAVVRGHACSQLAFTLENFDWQIWVDDVIPVIRRIVITYKKQPGAPRFAVTFTDWEFNVQLPDSVFAFEPPPGATRVEFDTAK